MKTATCGYTNLGSITGAQRLAFLGPILEVDVGFDASYHHASSSPPTPDVKGLQALVDTGAMQSCIDASLAMQLKLPIVNQVQVAGAHGAAMLNVHMAQVYVPTLPHLMWGNFVGADLVGGGQPIRAILGRDFLRHFKMSYNGQTGLVTIQDH
jgi:hypothetical protein